MLPDRVSNPGALPIALCGPVEIPGESTASAIEFSMLEKIVRIRVRGTRKQSELYTFMVII